MFSPRVGCRQFSTPKENDMKLWKGFQSRERTTKILWGVPSCKLTVRHGRSTMKWWYLPGKMGIFMGYVQSDVGLPEGNGYDWKMDLSGPNCQRLKAWLRHHMFFKNMYDNAGFYGCPCCLLISKCVFKTCCICTWRYNSKSWIPEILMMAKRTRWSQSFGPKILHRLISIYTILAHGQFRHI